MLKFILLTVLAVTFLDSGNAKEAEVRYIRDITEGPYQNYSGRALVQLGDGWYFFENTFASNWYEAKNFCRTLGLFLVSVETSEENELIMDHIWNVAGISNYWMSGNNLATLKDDWVWDSTGEKVTFFDWHVNQPDRLTTENHLHYWYEQGLLKWNNLNNIISLYGINNYAICEQL